MKYSAAILLVKPGTAYLGKNPSEILSKSHFLSSLSRWVFL